MGPKIINKVVSEPTVKAKRGRKSSFSLGFFVAPDCSGLGSGDADGVMMKSMGQFVPQKTVHVRTQYGTDKNNGKRPVTVAQIHRNRSGASTGNGPAHAKDGTAHNTFDPTRFFVCVVDDISVDVLHLETLDQGYSDSAQYHGSANDAVHVKRLETKHFLDPKPRHGFRFSHDDAKKHAQ